LKAFFSLVRVEEGVVGNLSSSKDKIDCYILYNFII